MNQPKDTLPDDENKWSYDNRESQRNYIVGKLTGLWVSDTNAEDAAHFSELDWTEIAPLCDEMGGPENAMPESTGIVTWTLVGDSTPRN